MTRFGLGQRAIRILHSLSRPSQPSSSPVHEAQVSDAAAATTEANDQVNEAVPKSGAGQDEGMRAGPDGLPLPPGELIALAIGAPDPDGYVQSGGLVAETILSHLASAGVHLEERKRVLDFGCGTGRILRFYKDILGPRFYGTDYNPRLIEWARANLPFAEYGTNGLEPGLSYEDGFFDLIYAFSVFTHLTADQQAAWMQELMRILAPGGHLYFTTHGVAYLAMIPFALQDEFKQGKPVVISRDLAGANECAAFHPESYVRDTLCKGLRIVGFFPYAYPQDAYLVQKRAV